MTVYKDEKEIEHITEPRPGLFVVSRASTEVRNIHVCDTKSPCEGAFRARRREVFHDHMSVFGNVWSKTNHRVKDGKIYGSKIIECWCVQIDDLVGFVDKLNEECILGIDSAGFPYIKIRDDYLD